MATTLKCPECGLTKFKKEARVIILKGKDDSDDMEVVALTCSICNNIMLNATPRDKFEGTKVDRTHELGK